MKKQDVQGLKLKIQTVRPLSDANLRQVRGGGPGSYADGCSHSCSTCLPVSNCCYTSGVTGSYC